MAPSEPAISTMHRAMKAAPRRIMADPLKPHAEVIRRSLRYNVPERTQKKAPASRWGHIARRSGGLGRRGEPPGTGSTAAWQNGSEKFLPFPRFFASPWGRWRIRPFREQNPL